MKVCDIERNGTTYRVCHVPDWDADEPWVNDEGTGIVSEWTTRDKRPGEFVLISGRHKKRFYDFSATMKLAKADGWGILGDTTGMSKGEITLKAVMLDFERLRAWCDDRWHYLTIVVYPLTVDGDELKSKSKYLSGLESDSDELDAYALDLIDEFEGVAV
jgi:hypothetical protein